MNYNRIYSIPSKSLVQPLKHSGTVKEDVEFYDRVCFLLSDESTVNISYTLNYIANIFSDIINSADHNTIINNINKLHEYSDNLADELFNCLSESDANLYWNSVYQLPLIKKSITDNHGDVSWLLEFHLPEVVVGIRSGIVSNVVTNRKKEKFDELIKNIHSHLVINKDIIGFIRRSQWFHLSFHSIGILKNRILEMLKEVKDFKSESNMMMTVFSEKSPLIKINNLSTPTEISEQEGFKFLITGLFKKYRNKYAHNQLEEIDKQECINVLFMVTECLDVLDNIPEQ